MLSIILVAAGSGKRMQSDIPKQFIELNGKMILQHTIESFLFLKEKKEFIIVLSSKQDCLDYIGKIIKAFPNEILNFIDGGKERFHSVKNALEHINAESKTVLIHDGVRPFATQEMIKRGIDCCNQNHSAIPAINLSDTIRKVKNDVSEHRNRNEYKLIQTPQIFNTNLIKEAYNTQFNDLFTDDASVFEANKGKVSLYEGDKKNFKITRKEDLDYAQFLLDK